MGSDTMLEELYLPGDELPTHNQQVRNLLHSAYWHGVALGKINGVPELTTEDKVAMVRAVLEGFHANRDYRRPSA